MTRSAKKNAVSDVSESVATVLAGTLDSGRRRQPKLYDDGPRWPGRADSDPAVETARRA
ncbi:MAG: hypothetical protein V3U67_05145 [Gemmatimonadota bacterium]